MKVTITARGYEGLKGEIAQATDTGARVIVNRKGIDLAPRVISFTWDAIKGGKKNVKTQEPAKPVEEPVTVTLTRKGEYTREYRMTGVVNGETLKNEIVRRSSTADYTHASLTKVPSGRVTGTVFDKGVSRASGDSETREVLTFHKSESAALKGNGDLRKSALSVRVIEIKEIEAEDISNEKPKCRICGRRIEPADTDTTWRHLPTVAGLDADRDHDAESK